MKYPNNLKMYRSKTNRSLQDIAYQMKVNKNLIAKWERGQLDIPLPKAVELANYFGISCHALVLSSKSPRIVLENLTEKQRQIVIDLYHSLTER